MRIIPCGDAAAKMIWARRGLGRGRSPALSAIICTRDRPGPALRAVCSILDGDWRDVEVLVLDQSADDATERLMARVARDDARLRYWRVPTRGKTRALNVGVQLARGRLLAFTDDDCVAPRGWLRSIVDAFDRESELALLVGGVVAAPHDERRGFVPTYEPPRPLVGLAVLTSGWSPMGANMAMRRELVDGAGPFDPVLGAGGPLRSSFDVEYCYRAYRRGYRVRALPGISVTHDGFRTWAQGQRLVRAYAFGTAAAYMKHVRLGDPLALLLLLRDLGAYSWRGVRQAARGRRPLHLAAIGYRLYGMLASYRFSIDRATRTYRDPSARGVAGNETGTRETRDDTTGIAGAAR